MCQEIHLCDLRLALLDHYASQQDDEDHACVLIDDLLDELAAMEGPDEADTHAREHQQRETELLLAGDDDAAAIHRALLKNMQRAKR